MFICILSLPIVLSFTTSYTEDFEDLSLGINPICLGYPNNCASSNLTLCPENKTYTASVENPLAIACIQYSTNNTGEAIISNGNPAPNGGTKSLVAWGQTFLGYYNTQDYIFYDIKFSSPVVINQTFLMSYWLDDCGSGNKGWTEIEFITDNGNFPNITHSYLSPTGSCVGPLNFTNYNITYNSFPLGIKDVNISQIKFHLHMDNFWFSYYYVWVDSITITTYNTSVPLPVCGNSICESGETCSNCPGDCGGCGGGGGGGGGSTLIELPKESLPTELVCSPGFETVTIHKEEIVTKYIDVKVPYFIEESVSSDTCGIDADQDGNKCDLNEDFLSCSSDCSINIDELTCINGFRCMWTEAWFLQIVLILQSIGSLYLIYLLFLV